MPHRVKYFREAEIFDAFTRFEPATGRLVTIDVEEYERARAKAVLASSGTAEGIDRYETAETVVFTGETREFCTRFPRRIYFQITRNCSLECPYCFLNARPGLPHVPTEAILNLAAFLGRNGLMEVRLTGGEPTTHPDFFRIVDVFQQNGVYVSVATNGLMSRQILDGLAQRNGLWLICSLDGARDTHEAYRPGTFDAILANIKYLKQKSPGFRLRLTAVLTKRNKGQIRDLAIIARDVGAESVTIIPLRPQVRNSEVRDEMITAQEFRSVLAQMVQCIKEFGVPMSTTLATDLESKVHQDPIVRKRSACAAGREATNLDYDWRKKAFLVYACSYSPAPDLDAPDNLRKAFLAGEFPADKAEEFFQIWRNDSAWAIYRDRSFKSESCLSCGYFSRRQCVGSCPIQNVNYAGLDARMEALEQLREQLSRTAEWYCYQRYYPQLIC